MRRIAGGALVIGVLAAALFAAGSLSPFTPEPSHSSPALSRRTGNLLGPAVDTGKLDDTIAVLQARLNEFGADADSLASLGLAYLQKGRATADPSYYPKAEDVLRKSLRLGDAENFSASLGMGVLAAARHDFRVALTWGRKARSANPHNADARGVIGDSFVELGRYRAADRAIQAMVNLRPDISSYARVSYLRELRGDVDGAIKAMKLAASASLGSPEDGAWVAYQLGDLYFNSGQLRSARREYARGAFLAPGYAPPFAGLARVAAAHGHLDRARTMLAKVVRSYPNPEFVILLGDLNLLQGRQKGASAQYELVRKMAELYSINGVNTDLEMALLAADRGLRVRATVAQARAEYERRPSIHAADTLAWALYAKGDYRTAERFSEKALRLGTRSALFHFHRGMIAWRLDDRSGALRHLKTAITLNPDFSFRHSRAANRVLARLGGATSQ